MRFKGVKVDRYLVVVLYILIGTEEVELIGTVSDAFDRIDNRGPPSGLQVGYVRLCEGKYTGRRADLRTNEAVSRCSAVID